MWSGGALISWTGAPAMPAYKYVDWKGSDGMLATRRSAGVKPKVNLRNTWCTRKKHAGKEIHPGLETQNSRHQKSKKGYQWSHKKNWCRPNNFLKNIQKEFSHRSARLDSAAYRNKVHGLAVFGAGPAWLTSSNSAASSFVPISVLFIRCCFLVCKNSNL